MDEMTFLRELGETEEKLPVRRNALRQAAIWRRIRETNATELEQVDRYVLWLGRLDVAAAIAIVFGAGALYSLTHSLITEVYWSGALHTLSTFF